MAAMNMPRPPEVTLFHTWQLAWQGIKLADIAEFLQTDVEYLVALVVGRIEQGAEVEGVRKWARAHMVAGTTHTVRGG